jgi:hypothetical protein
MGATSSASTVNRESGTLWSFTRGAKQSRSIGGRTLLQPAGTSGAMTPLRGGPGGPKPRLVKPNAQSQLCCALREVERAAANGSQHQTPPIPPRKVESGHASARKERVERFAIAGVVGHGREPRLEAEVRAARTALSEGGAHINANAGGGLGRLGKLKAWRQGGQANAARKGDGKSSGETGSGAVVHAGRSSKACATR